MKQKIETKPWLWSLFLLSLLLFGFSCNDNDSECTVNEEIANLNCPVSPVCGNDGDIIGKWKLVKATEAWGMDPQTTDYSCDHIICCIDFFQKNGFLITCVYLKNICYIALRNDISAIFVAICNN